jgi:quinol monooxygenase YgiN
MSAFNVVRFRVKPGQETRFLDAHRDGQANWPGMLRGVMIRTGDRTYCLIGEWADTDAIAEARSKMIATLNSFRDTLEDLGAGLGVTDAVSGLVVLDLTRGE